MKKDSKKVKNKASPMKTALFMGIAFFVGWLAVQPLKSNAAVDAPILSTGIVAFIPTSLITSVVTIAVLGVGFLFVLITGEVMVRFLALKLQDWREQRAERLVSKNQTKQIEFDKKVEWRDINSWQGMPREVMKAEKLIADQEKLDNKEKALARLGSPTKGYSVLKVKKDIAKHYAQINDLSSTIERGLSNQRDIERAADLKELANKVLAGLQSLYDLDQIDSFVLLEADHDGSRAVSDYTHADRAETKLSEINNALRAIVVEEAMKISNDIESISLPKHSVLFSELETLKSEGERLLSIIKSQDTSVSSESVFVLEKITQERLDALWNDYNNAKDSMFEKSHDPLSLASSSATQNPDKIINDVFNDIRAIYKEVENSIRTSQEDTAINNLLITKNYFNKR